MDYERTLYPEIEPYDSGMLDVGEGHTLYWERVGTPGAKPAVFLHGGPGGGMSANHRRQWDPELYDGLQAVAAVFGTLVHPGYIYPVSDLCAYRIVRAPAAAGRVDRAHPYDPRYVRIPRSLHQASSPLQVRSRAARGAA